MLATELMPDSPAAMPDHMAGTPIPTGLTTPMPVTATPLDTMGGLLSSGYAGRCGQLAGAGRLSGEIISTQRAFAVGSLRKNAGGRSRRAAAAQTGRIREGQAESKEVRMAVDQSYLVSGAV